MNINKIENPENILSDSFSTKDIRFWDPTVEHQEELSWLEELEWELNNAEENEDYGRAYNLVTQIEEQNLILDSMEIIQKD